MTAAILALALAKIAVTLLVPTGLLYALAVKTGVMGRVLGWLGVEGS